MSAYQNRILQEYYDIMMDRGVEAADMVYDAYEGAGRFTDGPTALDRGRDFINKGGRGKKALAALDRVADPIQEVLQKGAGKIPLGKGGAMASRMAGGAIGKAAARGIPVLGTLMTVADAGDIVLGNESMANKAMDTLGMGIGGTAGFFLGGGPFGAAVGAGLGKSASDALQYLFGDKKSPEQRKMEEALQLLRGGMI